MLEITSTNGQNSIGGYYITPIVSLTGDSVTLEVVFRTPDPSPGVRFAYLSEDKLSATAASPNKAALALVKKMESYLGKLTKQGKPWPTRDCGRKHIKLFDFPPLPPVKNQEQMPLPMAKS
jgi:hypothetical protein